ncbi:hypothetical protein RUND412_011314 [Rhizina undulata]
MEAACAIDVVAHMDYYLVFLLATWERLVAFLAGSIVLAEVCGKIAGGPRKWWAALLPVTVFFLRNFGRVEVALGSTRGDVGNKPAGRRLLLLTTVSAVVTVTPAFISNNALALGACATVFWALSYVFLEKCIISSSAAANTPVNNVGSVRAGDEYWPGLVTLGRELGAYLVVGFALATVLFEGLWLGNYARNDDKSTLAAISAMMFVMARVFGVAILGAVKWFIILQLVSKNSSVGAGLLELITALFSGIFTPFSVTKFVGTLVSVAGTAAFITNLSSCHKSEIPINLKRIKIPQIIMTSILLCLTIAIYFLWGKEAYNATPSNLHITTLPITTTFEHPILQLRSAAWQNYAEVQSRQSKSLAAAVSEYKRRYGIPPPPNFDRWYEFAVSRESVLIDEFDTIYHALKPFWGLPPREIRRRAREAIGFNDPIGLGDNKLLHAAIRDGGVQIGGQGPDWQKEATQGMIESFVEFLPDMDLAFNIHDEPRVVVPHDMLKKYLDVAEETLSRVLAGEVEKRNSFTPLGKEEKKPVEDFPRTRFNVFAHQSVWNHAILSCPPESPVRSLNFNQADQTSSFTLQPLGFIKNQTDFTNICHSPSLEYRHGFFDRPNAFNVIHLLYPIFSQSKVSSFNDILYPSPWYWAEKVKYNETRDMSWESKSSTLYWRGSTTGGFSRNGGWRRQHRQRAVDIVNSNNVTKTLEQKHRGGSGEWTIKESEKEYLSNLFDVHFSHVGQCDPEDCEAQKSHFTVAPLADQQDAWGAKFLLDLDGNTFSGRFYAFLESRSSVLKQAVFREWHEEWVWPWVHYVPVSMEMEEIREVMRFLMAEGANEGKDVADEGRRWAGKVLRKVDFEVWFFRLLLEYARVIDDDRETIGFSV